MLMMCALMLELAGATTVVRQMLKLTVETVLLVNRTFQVSINRYQHNKQILSELPCTACHVGTHID